MRTAHVRRTGAGLPWGLLGMLGLVWAIEGRVARIEALPLLAACWDDAAMAAGREAVACDVICLGDSQVKLGVHPRVIRERVGLSAYNLAVHRGMPASSYHLLRCALDAGARPRAVVVDFFPGLLATPPRLNASLWIRLLGPDGSARLLYDAPDPSLAVRMIAGWLLPSFGFRDELRDGVLSSFQGDPSPSRRVLQRYRENWRTNVGAELSEGGREFAESGANPLPGTPVPRWQCRPENEAYVRRLLDLASAHQVAVYWLIPPLSPTVRATRRANGQEADLTVFIQRIQKDYPDLTVIDGRGLGLEVDKFVDAVHVNTRGAGLLSAAVGDVLAGDTSKTGRNDRWVTLSLDVPRPELAGPGDTSRSRSR